MLKTQEEICEILRNLPPAPLADDTPSRHPCKVRIASAQKRFMFNPYRGRVMLDLTAARNGGADDDDDDDVSDNFFGAADAVADAVVAQPQPFAAYQQFHGYCEQQAQPPAQFVSDDSDGSEGYAGAPVLFAAPVVGFLAPLPVAAMQAAPPQPVRSAATGAHYAAEGNCYRMAPGTIHHALVRFKFTEEVYFVPPQERRGIAVGDLVVVDGDRGENVGAVVADVSSQHDEFGLSGNRAGCVLRRALNKDRKRYFQARRKEGFANRAAQELVRELDLKMSIVDAEFQCDLAKVTIFYRTLCDGPVDFRQLQRALFKSFRCRIWLLNWDTEVRKQSTLTPPPPPRPVALQAADAAQWQPFIVNPVGQSSMFYVP